MTRKTKLAVVAAALFAAPLVAEEPQTSSTQSPPGEIRVVYPSSATSNEPILYEPRDVVPPRSESRDAPFGSDVETPIGQVRAVLATLDELRRSQTALESKLDALGASRPELDVSALDARFDALSETLAERDETNAATLGERLDALSETLASQPLPPDPKSPPGWALVVALTSATCLLSLGRVVCSGVASVCRFASTRRDEAFAARLAEFEAARKNAPNSSNQ